ncbi:MAG TPA: diacylglycerol kinase family protein, partial [Pyrinomonadaceae bacterium]|nr:diacylglycerol kinase family protein [Pyrinomonadaceae bacterium]
MFPVERALLIINRAAGTGQGESVTSELALLFKHGLEGLSDVQIELVSDHAAARACAAQFVSESDGQALIVAGGGGGTLRAVIEGICESPGRVRVGALRMGSGNVLARQFGVPRDPVRAPEGLLTNLKAGQIVPCCVMRCETLTSLGNLEIHHAVTLGGLGQFGRIPSDLARWHGRFPFLHESAARAFGIEKLTNIEYALAFLIRSISCMLFPEKAELVEIQFQGQTKRLRLLSGVVMNFPIKALPFKPAVTVEDEALAAYLIPLNLRIRRHRIEKAQRLEIRLLDRECVELFLDEDPVTT